MRVFLLASLLLSYTCAIAADGLTPAQQRLRSCNTQAKAKGLSHTARSRFITDCLNGREAGRPLTPLQAKNQACTKEADGRHLEGAERRGFMSDCTKPDRVKHETPQRIKVENCHLRAGRRGLDGEERRKFVAGCLDGSNAVFDD